MRLGLDVSSRDVAAILANENGESQLALRAPLPPGADSHAIWNTVMQTAREVLHRAGIESSAVRRAALAFPAPLDAHGVVPKDARFPGWNSFDLPRGMREHIGIADAIAAPRVVCEALGEWKFGALRENSIEFESENSPASTLNADANRAPSTDWLFVHVGANLSAAAFINGKLLRGSEYAALDLGAVCVERDGMLSPTGRRGALEAYCGGDAFMERARSYSILLNQAHEVWNLTESNFAAKSLCDDYVSRLAQGLGITLAMFNPSRLVLGGSMIDALGDKLMAPLQFKLREFCGPRHYQNLSVAAATLRGDAAVIGAVVLAMENEN